MSEHIPAIVSIAAGLMACAAWWWEYRKLRKRFIERGMELDSSRAGRRRDRDLHQRELEAAREASKSVVEQLTRIQFDRDKRFRAHYAVIVEFDQDLMRSDFPLAQEQIADHVARTVQHRIMTTNFAREAADNEWKREQDKYRNARVPYGPHPREG